MLPEYPMNIGVISARTGAATQDVFTTIKRRWPLASVFFYPCLVQGKEAEADLIKTLKLADSNHHDCIFGMSAAAVLSKIYGALTQKR